MTRAVPWNVDGVDFDAREAAKAAARRAGMSLGEWLASIIADQAAELGVTADDIDDDERLEAVAARLATLSKRPEQNVSRGLRRSHRDDREAARRVELADLRRARAVYDEVDRRARPSIDSELLLDRAIAAFDRSAKFANDKTSAALAKVSHRLAEIEGHLERGLQPRDPSPAKEVLSRLDARLEGIARRLEQAEAKTPVGGRPEDITRIEAKLNRLSETIDRAARPQLHPGQRQAPLARRSVSDAIAEITRRQAVLDQGAQAAPAPVHLGNLQADLTALSTRLEEMRRDIVAHDEQQFRAIGEKIEALGAARPDAATLARIRAQTEEIRDLLTAAVAQPRPIENIEGQIAALAGRFEAVATRGSAPSADSTDPLLQQIEGRIEALTQKVEEVLSNSAGSEHFDELRQRLDFIHQSLAARMERPAPPFDSAAFEGMMREIVGKLDRPPPAAVVAPQLENLLSLLADRLEAPAQTRRFEELLADLADKIDTAAKPQADLPALNALQDQIERLARRLDDADVNAGALGSLERSIADLFAGLEETRRAAVDAAESAARTAARDTMREVVSSAAGMQSDAGGQADNVTRELADIRALQSAADRQTHATLTAVHETLEKVVDRLAMLEDDITDVRGVASEPPSAAGPPPLFAPSPQQSSAPKMPRATFPDFTPAPPRRSESSPAQDAPPAPRLEDRDFLIEPGTGFSPERRSGEPDRRGTNTPPRPPATRDSPAPPSAPSTPSAPSEPPPAGSSQANFIAAARRTIQANATEREAASATPRKATAALDGMLVEARSRARAVAAAFTDDRTKEADKARPEPLTGGVLTRVNAFFTTRKRALMLGLAGVIMVLGALEFLRIQASPQVVVVDEKGVPAPSQTPPARAAEPASKVSLPPGSVIPPPSVDPTTSGSFQPTGMAPAKTSSFVAPGIDRSPVGSIATPSVTPPVGPAADSGAGDLPAVRNLAASGNAAAELELGLRYAEGRSLPRNLALAAQWLAKAALQNNAPAQYRLATLYEKGLGVARDTAVALNWYQRAAAAGNIRAMHNLAVLTAEGTDGKPDYDDAAIWFRKAAEFGIGDSQYNLAILYARGLGVQKDLQQSYIWFALAAARGDEDAATKRDEVANHLDPKQLADAKAIIDGFTPRKAPDSANNDVPPPGGWDTLKAAPSPDAKHAPGAKVSTL